MAFPFRSCDALLLFNPDAPFGANANFAYHSGTDSDNTVLLWTKKGKTLITAKMNQAKCSLSPHRVISVERGSKISEAIRKLLPKGKIHVGLDMESISAQNYVRIKSVITANFLDASEELSSLRVQKSAAEISKIRKACRLSAGILESLELGLSMSEQDVAMQLSIKTAEAGAQFAFPPIVATGKNSSMPHHTPTGKKLSGIVLVDFGVKHEGYCSDLTRCFFLGPCKKEKEKYEEAMSIFDEIIRALPSCKTAGGIAKKSEQIVSSHGWPAMVHAIGHGLGLEVHEAPHLHPSSKERLPAGATLAIEPGWYGEKFGVRYENDIVIGGRGAKVLL